MDILKEAKKLAVSATKKASEVANDINDKLEKRKEIRELLEKMADFEDEIIMYLLTLNEDELKMLSNELKDNISAIKKLEEEINLIQTEDIPEIEEFEQSVCNSEERFCTKCGKEIDPTDIYCRYCGSLR